MLLKGIETYYYIDAKKPKIGSRTILGHLNLDHRKIYLL